VPLPKITTELISKASRQQQPISEVVLAAHHAAAVEDIHTFAAQDIHTFAAQQAAAAVEDIHTFAIHTAEDVSSVGRAPATSPALVTPFLLSVPTAIHSPTTAATTVGRATAKAPLTDHVKQSPVQASVDLTCLTNHPVDALSSAHDTPTSTKGGHAADDTPPSAASPSRHSSGFVSGYAPSLSHTSEPWAATASSLHFSSLLVEGDSRFASGFINVDVQAHLHCMRAEPPFGMHDP